MQLITGIFAAMLALNNATWAEDSVVMTLCDNWDFYTGGRQQFLKWRGI
jgi:hypothetical protein